MSQEEDTELDAINAAFVCRDLDDANLIHRPETVDGAVVM